MTRADDDDLSIAFIAAGAPPVISTAPVPSLGPDVQRVGLADGSWWLVRTVPTGSTRSARRAGLAGILARSISGLPVPARVAVLEEGLPVSAVAHPWPDGVPLAVGDRPETAAVVGGVLRRLGEAAMPWRGTHAASSGFLPRAPRWSEEVLRVARRDAAAARATGRDLGTLTDALVQLVGARADALDAGTRAVLVHGSLGPRRVWIDEQGAVTCVLGWERACLGDPEQDWASVVMQPELPAVCRGFGVLEASQLLGTEGIARVEAHLARLILARLAEEVDEALPGSRGAHLGALASALLAGGEVQRRMGAALEPTGVGRLAAPLAGPTVVATRRALDVLARAPGPESSEAFLGALGLVGLAERIEAERAPLLARAHRLLATTPCGPPECPDPQDLLLETWLRPAAHRVLADLRDHPILLGQAAATLWLGVTALDRLGDAAPRGAPWALDEHLTALLAMRDAIERTMPRSPERLVAAQRVMHGLLAAGALSWLGERLADLELREDLGRAVRELRAGARQLQLEQYRLAGLQADVAAAVTLLPDGLAGALRVVPAVLLAIDGLPDGPRDDVPAVGLLDVLGVPRR